MALYLIGLNLDSPTAHYRVERGFLIQLLRGIYADATDDVDVVVLQHAVRIAKYLYPNTYLAGASAILLGPTEDGRLFLSGRRKQRTRIRALEIVQNQAPEHPSIAPALLKDPMGEFSVDVSSIRQRFLEAFRSRSEQSASISIAMKQALVERLSAEYGGASNAVDAIWALARENQWYREGEAAQRLLLLEQPPIVEPANKNTHLHVTWHGVPLGQLHNDGFEWRWTAEQVDLPSPVRDTIPGKLPPFISSLLPEGWLEEILQSHNEQDVLLSGRRYMSNIAIVDDLAKLSIIPVDTLNGRLAQWVDRGRFTGTYAGSGQEDFVQAVAELYRYADTPRLSGVQIKVPMFLNASGQLLDARGRPFTHILKPAGAVGFEATPIVEWTALELARHLGFTVPAHALVEMPQNLPPALIVERFDIRCGSEDAQKLYCLEDFCSLLSIPSAAKYDSTIERVAKTLRPVSTKPEEDLLLLFRRALFAWLIADGDMHLKNLAVLRTATPGERSFLSVRLAPVYDTLTTRVFPVLAQDRMALKLNGKDDHLQAKDFLALARTIGIKVAIAEEMIEQMAKELMLALQEVRLPPMSNYGSQGLERFAQIQEIVETRCRELG
jgi:serine/threonine-protein kinase HipA